MLLPQPALQKTISSVAGAKSQKQMGQSPAMGLRFEWEEGEEEGRDGAWAKMVRSSCYCAVREGI